MTMNIQACQHLLFLCVANSARSQMAEGWAKKLLPSSIYVQSAGSQPSHVHPLAIQVMNEVGIDLGKHTSKAIASIDLSHVDVIVTLCAEEVCPIVQHSCTRLHWPLKDPAGKTELPIEEQIQRFRTTREELRKAISSLAFQIAP
jgi:arsenate reductase (thioredoxin)